MDIVNIDRLRFALHAQTTRERADALLSRARAALAQHLPQAIAARTPFADNGRYLFIERLEFSCAVQAAWGDDRLAEVLAGALARELAAAPADAGRATIYRDRAEYLAAFLIALAEGKAWSEWRFDEFDGLKPLSASSALRTVLGSEGATALEALARLTDVAARRVLDTLTEADAMRLLAHLAPAQGASAPSPAVLWPLLEHPLAAALAGQPRRRLAWLVLLPRTAPGHAHAATLETLAWLDALRERTRAGRLAPALHADGSPAALLAAGCAAAGLDPGPLAACSPDDCAELLARLRALEPGAERLYCPHGGAWLLLVRLLRLGWWMCWRDRLLEAGRADADPLAARLALAVVARALGGPGYAAIEADTALRSALRIDEAPAARQWPSGLQRLLASTLALEARDWLRRHAPAGRGQSRLERALQRGAYRLLAEFAQRLPGCAESSPDHLRRQCLLLGSQVRIGADRVEIELGRAPLGVLLALAGLTRCSAQLPGGRTLALLGEAER